ncbi:hypothetical protein NQ314_006473 [Rhamnusium bicolor]|uniref:Uncharacterized protein n=1 Tax=Rhamnusium bicolor TaxID=1586634 RepID=A0AAV8Z364_9CUCU|nr:hypothetical protein NQ314_006473 [Rhamnusium bicolor]
MEINKNSFTLDGKSEKGDGYAGEIVFVTVNGTSKENKKKILHWVIKHAKRNPHLRKTIPMKAAFDNEIYIYDKVLPTFKKFQLENNISDVFDSVPKCYKTLIFHNMEVLVLDNLKAGGFELYDKRIPFNTCHLKTILKEYGKLHALSFALRYQRHEEFSKLTKFGIDVLKMFHESSSIKEIVQKAVINVLSMLEENNEFGLMENFKALMEKGVVNIFSDLLAQQEPQSVICIGECEDDTHFGFTTSTSMFCCFVDGNSREGPRVLAPIALLVLPGILLLLFGWFLDGALEFWCPLHSWSAW